MKGFSASLDMRSCKDWDCQASVCSSVLVSTMIKAFSITAPWVLDKPCVIALRQISVTALFYLEIARESILEEEKTVEERSGVGGQRERERTNARWWERARAERAPTLGSSYTFSSPWACSMQIGLSPECCSTWSPHSSPLFYFLGLSPSLSFSCHFGLLFPILTT